MEKLNKSIYEAYQPLIEEKGIKLIDGLEYIEKSKKFIQTKVKCSSEYLILNQLITYLLYCLIDNYSNKTLEYNPLTDSELEPLYINMGK